MRAVSPIEADTVNDLQRVKATGFGAGAQFVE